VSIRPEECVCVLLILLIPCLALKHGGLNTEGVSVNPSILVFKQRRQIKRVCVAS
jgi:hypothetical protein